MSDEELKPLKVTAADQFWGCEGGIALNVVRQGGHVVLQIIGDTHSVTEHVLAEITLEPYRAIRLRDHLSDIAKEWRTAVDQQLAKVPE